MTTSLDAYRSDREQLLARVRELEAELHKTKRFDWLTACPMCGTVRKAGSSIEDKPGSTWRGWTYPRVCSGWSRHIFCWKPRPHFHQRCTACGARWVVDAEGWRFD